MRSIDVLESAIPGTTPQTGVLQAAEYHLLTGQMLEVRQGITADSPATLRIYAEAEPGLFAVHKIPAPSDQPIPDALQWSLLQTSSDPDEALQDKINWLLLAPSVLGNAIYGSHTPFASEVQDLYGIIQVASGPQDSLELRITMPKQPYKGLGSLALHREIIDSSLLTNKQ